MPNRLDQHVKPFPASPRGWPRTGLRSASPPEARERRTVAGAGGLRAATEDRILPSDAAVRGLVPGIHAEPPGPECKTPPSLAVQMAGTCMPSGYVPSDAAMPGLVPGIHAEPPGPECKTVPSLAVQMAGTCMPSGSVPSDAVMPGLAPGIHAEPLGPECKTVPSLAVRAGTCRPSGSAPEKHQQAGTGSSLCQGRRIPQIRQTDPGLAARMPGTRPGMTQAISPSGRRTAR